MLLFECCSVVVCSIIHNAEFGTVYNISWIRCVLKNVPVSSTPRCYSECSGLILNPDVGCADICSGLSQPAPASPPIETQNTE